MGSRRAWPGLLTRVIAVADCTALAASLNPLRLNRFSTWAKWRSSKFLLALLECATAKLKGPSRVQGASSTLRRCHWDEMVFLPFHVLAESTDIHRQSEAVWGDSLDSPWSKRTKDRESISGRFCVSDEVLQKLHPVAGHPNTSDILSESWDHVDHCGSMSQYTKLTKQSRCISEALPKKTKIQLLAFWPGDHPLLIRKFQPSAPITSGHIAYCRCCRPFGPGCPGFGRFLSRGKPFNVPSKT